MRIQPIPVSNFRQVAKLLDTKKLAYHTYQLPEEKSLKTVLRSVPIGVAEKDILQELKDIDYPVLQVWLQLTSIYNL